MVTLEPCGEPIDLLPEKAALLPEHGLLLIADVHVGKAVSFRKLGVPVPRGTTSETLERLSALIERVRPAEVVFLGDFLHSAHSHASSTLGALARWRARHATLPLTLVRGNHDARAGDPPHALGIRVVDAPLQVGPWALSHHPVPRAGAYVLCGHVHPGVIVGRGFDRVRLPCFVFDDAVGILPAFGAFTGTQPVHPHDGRRVYAVGQDDVFGPL